jgi:hypothetical protein
MIVTRLEALKKIKNNTKIKNENLKNKHVIIIIIA